MRARMQLAPAGEQQHAGERSGGARRQMGGTIVGLHTDGWPTCGTTLLYLMAMKTMARVTTALA